jgi:hypothetical protein
LVLCLLLQAVRPIEITPFWSLAFYGFYPKSVFLLVFVLMPVVVALGMKNKKTVLETLQYPTYFLILLFGVYFVTNLLVPGYVYSGYVSRALPLATFSFYPLFGAVLLFLVQPTPGVPWARYGGALLAGGTLFIWLWSSASFFRWMPPDGATAFQEAAKLKGTGQGIVTPNYFMPFAYEAGTYALWCQETNEIKPEEPVLPVQFRREKWWLRKGPDEAGLSMPTTFVSFKQRSNLLSWAEELPQLPQKIRNIPPSTLGASKRKETISWHPLPAIRFQSEEVAFQVPAPAQPGKLANRVDVTQKKPNSVSKAKRLETIQDYLTLEAGSRDRETSDHSLRIFQQGSRLMVVTKPSQASPPWKEAKVFLFETQHKNPATQLLELLQKKYNSKSESQTEQLVAFASASEGFPNQRIREGNSYRIGFQPLGTDGRDGLVYLSNPFTREDLVVED